MALYEFECAACGERFEVRRPMADYEDLREHSPVCPKCAATDTRELTPLINCKTPTG